MSYLSKLLPMGYFWGTRIEGNSWTFHLAFEWFPALMVTLLFSGLPWSMSIALTFANYLAFICVYECGYVCNDYFTTRHEELSRTRGSEKWHWSQVVLLIVIRLLVFGWLAHHLGKAQDYAWLGFFAFLALVFTLHNQKMGTELKLITFAWLSLMRFVAPCLFLLPSHYRFPLIVSGLLFYTGFRSLAYLDSKGALRLPGRRSWQFRISYFVSILPLSLALQGYAGARILLILGIYFSVLAILGARRVAAHQ
jgi:hypothetical protein